MEAVVSLLKELNYTISSCESLTGGLFSKTITDVPGASQVFKGSIVAYSNQAKIDVVSINAEVFNKYGAVSKECALAMAQNVRAIFKTDVAVSFTGNAGPNASENKPVGLIYIALVFEKFFIIEELSLSGTREEIRNEVVKQAQAILAANLIRIKKESSK
ncbi:CinA family protein [Spiroplasma platyhelix]|uniref:CinA family protein n=1 Tax=Spiroplasma platyhelix PALS-1 TaxID=1276218 RepID=A0A846UCR6_9MOLU|nr:CinA family protein [Spiroplasma platyhelix]MBE4703935.1 Protein MG115 [Spiroplasma platyhelix PALS-1]NKE38308.1 CinA family protein [Spiroplasma platyhelix PALS-1]UJB29193.1 competence damage-inducible protein A [Spiroplasma platyhelix PALS-1]